MISGLCSHPHSSKPLAGKSTHSSNPASSYQCNAIPTAAPYGHESKVIFSRTSRGRPSVHNVWRRNEEARRRSRKLPAPHLNLASAGQPPPQLRGRGEQQVGGSRSSPEELTPGSRSKRRGSQRKRQARRHPEIGDDELREKRPSRESKGCNDGEPDEDGDDEGSQPPPREGSHADSNLREMRRPRHGRRST